MHPLKPGYGALELLAGPWKLVAVQCEMMAHPATRMGKKRSEVARLAPIKYSAIQRHSGVAHSADTISDPAIPIGPTEQPWECCFGSSESRKERGGTTGL